MKTSDRISFLESLQIAQARTIDVELTDKLVLALINEGFCFSRPAPAWCIGTLPHHDTSIQVEFDNNDVHLIRLAPWRKRNSFPVKPDISFTVHTEDDISRAVDEFNTLFHGRVRIIDMNDNLEFDRIHYDPRR